MTTPLSKHRRDAQQIWQAGVDAVSSERLVADAVRVQQQQTELLICGELFLLKNIGNIAVVGAGKAGAGMAVAVERALGNEIVDAKVSGWVNVPADCLRPTRKIHLHPARPAGLNEPTEDGVHGTIQILETVSQLQPNDLCLVLISGGGSALLPAPVPEISLTEKQAVTRFLMHSGASIDELNTVRKQISRVKGGRLANASTAGTTITLIISDVIGDPLEIIASGPTVPDSSTPQQAISVLQKYQQKENSNSNIPQTIWDFLNSAAETATQKTTPQETIAPKNTVRNCVIGNNRVAVNAAAEKAISLGYEVVAQETDRAGIAAELGKEFAEQAIALRDADQQTPPTSDRSTSVRPKCLLSGGEPIVHLATTNQPRKGGRNQELVLAGLAELWDDGMKNITLLSGGTDGEDGPTDAAGAFADAALIAHAKQNKLSPTEFLAINNSYPFFESINGLLKTGPTHTNVMDLRVILIEQ